MKGGLLLLMFVTLACGGKASSSSTPDAASDAGAAVDAAIDASADAAVYAGESCDAVLAAAQAVLTNYRLNAACQTDNDCTVTALVTPSEPSCLECVTVWNASDAIAAGSKISSICRSFFAQGCQVAIHSCFVESGYCDAGRCDVGLPNEGTGGVQ